MAEPASEFEDSFREGRGIHEANDLVAARAPLFPLSVQSVAASTKPMTLWRSKGIMDLVEYIRRGIHEANDLVAGNLRRFYCSGD